MAKELFFKLCLCYFKVENKDKNKQKVQQKKIVCDSCCVPSVNISCENYYNSLKRYFHNEFVIVCNVTEQLTENCSICGGKLINGFISDFSIRRITNINYI